MGESKKHIECNQRGFPALCARFRAFINSASRPREEGEDIMGPWGDMRLRVARTFVAVEGIDGETFNALVQHVPIFQNRGRRTCAKCHTQVDLIKAFGGGRQRGRK